MEAARSAGERAERSSERARVGLGLGLVVDLQRAKKSAQALAHSQPGLDLRASAKTLRPSRARWASPPVASRALGLRSGRRTAVGVRRQGLSLPSPALSAVCLLPFSLSALTLLIYALLPS